MTRWMFATCGFLAAAALAACSQNTPMAPSPNASATAQTTVSSGRIGVSDKGGSKPDDPKGHDGNDDHGSNPNDNHGSGPGDNHGPDPNHSPAPDPNDDKGHDPNEPPERHDDAGEVEGMIAGLHGTCPSVTFSIGTTTVTTSLATVFEDGACAALANGVLVEVKGTRTGSTIAAAVVEQK